jgi:hypothetical protein
MVKLKKKGFYWRGIKDNKDGTYSAQGRVEKRRLLKSLHSSGYTVRSHRNDDGSWRVVTVGTKQCRRSPGPGYRPQTRFLRPGSQRRLSTGPTPRPTMIYSGGSARPNYQGTTILEKLRAHRQDRIEKEKQWKKNEQEINENMRKERIQAERAETVKQLRKQELSRESMAHERHEHAEKMRADIQEAREQQVIGG